MAPTVAKKCVGSGNDFVAWTNAFGHQTGEQGVATRGNSNGVEQPQYRAIAVSHSATLGPKMKCWETITSAIDASTSALIVEYCALRSSSGTCILSLLPQLSVRLNTLPQVCRERCFFIQIEAA